MVVRGFVDSDRAGGLEASSCAFESCSGSSILGVSRVEAFVVCGETGFVDAATFGSISAVSWTSCVCSGSLLLAANV